MILDGFEVRPVRRAAAEVDVAADLRQLFIREHERSTVHVALDVTENQMKIFVTQIKQLGSARRVSLRPHEPPVC